MFARAQERMLLIDHLKFGQPNLEVVCPLNEVNRIVTDKAPSRDMALALRKAEIELNL
jgi:DeoR/GlpR family transcriptional regulator of sugar metabolism